MKIIENSMVIMIPTWNVESVGLRDVIKKKDIPKIFDVMRSRQEQPMDNQTWNRRYREYMEKIKTGSLYRSRRSVYRDLSLLKMTKDLSFGETEAYTIPRRTCSSKSCPPPKIPNEKAVIKEIEALF
jgi:CarD family transcriptional regulator